MLLRVPPFVASTLYSRLAAAGNVRSESALAADIRRAWLTAGHDVEVWFTHDGYVRTNLVNGVPS
jgi:hypothetical protein